MRQWARRGRRAGQVEQVCCIAGRVADGGDVLRGAGGEVVWGDGEGGLEEGGGFDDGCDEAGGDVPFDVAVEKPDAWREGGGVLAGGVDRWVGWRGIVGW